MATTYRFIVTDKITENNTTTKIFWDYEGTADNGVVGLSIGSTIVNINNSTDEELLNAIEASLTEQEITDMKSQISDQINGYREV